jgi:hypothetical protein
LQRVLSLSYDARKRMGSSQPVRGGDPLPGDARALACRSAHTAATEDDPDARQRTNVGDHRIPRARQARYSWPPRSRWSIAVATEPDATPSCRSVTTQCCRPASRISARSRSRHAPLTSGSRCAFRRVMTAEPTPRRASLDSGRRRRPGADDAWSSRPATPGQTWVARRSRGVKPRFGSLIGRIRLGPRDRRLHPGFDPGRHAVTAGTPASTPRPTETARPTAGAARSRIPAQRQTTAGFHPLRSCGRRHRRGLQPAAGR